MTLGARYIQKVGGVCALIAYVYIALFGLLAKHYHDMSTAGCPYMIAEHSICQMDTLAHIEAWKEASTSTLPMIQILLASVVLGAVFLWYLSPPLWGRIHKRYKTVWVSLHQQLFSQGILHPKAP